MSVRVEPTRLLVFSHAGVLDVNRAVFQELARVASVDLTMVVPESWKGDLIRDLKFVLTENDQGIRVIGLPVLGAGSGSLFCYSKCVRKVLAPWTPEVVFIDEEPWSLAALQATAAFGRVPQFFFTKQNLRKRVPPPFNLIQRWVFFKSAGAFSVASEVSQTLEWKGYTKKITDLAHSFDPRCFHPVRQAEIEELKRELGIPPDALVISYFGRLTAEKGIDELCQAMRRAVGSPDLNHCHFLWVGNGPESERIRREIALMPRGRATLLGALPHEKVGRTLALSDLLVLPSRTCGNWKEQFGRILVEAMACGSAVIGSDSGEIPHLIGRTGGGLVFKERDSADLLSRIHELATQPHLLLDHRKRGQKYVSEIFTHRSVAVRLAQDLGLRLLDDVREGFPHRAEVNRPDAASL